MDTYHIPQNRIFQGSIPNDEVEGIGAWNGVKLRLPLSGVQLKLVQVLAIRLSHKHNLLARFLIVQPDKRLWGQIKMF